MQTNYQGRLGKQDLKIDQEKTNKTVNTEMQGEISEDILLAEEILSQLEGNFEMMQQVSRNPLATKYGSGTSYSDKTQPRSSDLASQKQKTSSARGVRLERQPSLKTIDVGSSTSAPLLSDAISQIDKINEEVQSLVTETLTYKQSLVIRHAIDKVIDHLVFTVGFEHPAPDVGKLAGALGQLVNSLHFLNEGKTTQTTLATVLRHFTALEDRNKVSRNTVDSDINAFESFANKLVAALSKGASKEDKLDAIAAVQKQIGKRASVIDKRIDDIENPKTTPSKSPRTKSPRTRKLVRISSEKRNVKRSSSLMRSLRNLQKRKLHIDGLIQDAKQLKVKVQKSNTDAPVLMEEDSGFDLGVEGHVQTVEKTSVPTQDVEGVKTTQKPVVTQKQLQQMNLLIGDKAAFVKEYKDLTAQQLTDLRNATLDVPFSKRGLRAERRQSEVESFCKKHGLEDKKQDVLRVAEELCAKGLSGVSKQHQELARQIETELSAQIEPSFGAKQLLEFMQLGKMVTEKSNTGVREDRLDAEDTLGVAVRAMDNKTVIRLLDLVHLNSETEAYFDDLNSVLTSGMNTDINATALRFEQFPNPDNTIFHAFSSGSGKVKEILQQKAPNTPELSEEDIKKIEKDLESYMGRLATLGKKPTENAPQIQEVIEKLEVLVGSLAQVRDSSVARRVYHKLGEIAQMPLGEGEVLKQRVQGILEMQKTAAKQFDRIDRMLVNLNDPSDKASFKVGMKDLGNLISELNTPSSVRVIPKDSDRVNRSFSDIVFSVLATRDSQKAVDLFERLNTLAQDKSFVNKLGKKGQVKFFNLLQSLRKEVRYHIAQEMQRGQLSDEPLIEIKPGQPFGGYKLSEKEEYDVIGAKIELVGQRDTLNSVVEKLDAKNPNGVFGAIKKHFSKARLKALGYSAEEANNLHTMAYVKDNAQQIVDRISQQLKTLEVTSSETKRHQELSVKASELTNLGKLQHILGEFKDTETTFLKTLLHTQEFLSGLKDKGLDGIFDVWGNGEVNQESLLLNLNYITEASQGLLDSMVVDGQGRTRPFERWDQEYLEKMDQELNGIKPGEDWSATGIDQLVKELQWMQPVPQALLTQAKRVQTMVKEKGIEALQGQDVQMLDDALRLVQDQPRVKQTDRYRGKRLELTESVEFIPVDQWTEENLQSLAEGINVYQQAKAAYGKYAVIFDKISKLDEAFDPDGEFLTTELQERLSSERSFIGVQTKEQKTQLQTAMKELSQEVEEKKKDFVQYAKDFQNRYRRPNNPNLPLYGSLASMLITPVQRGPRLKMLAADAGEKAGRLPNNPSGEAFFNAFSSIADQQTHYVNELKRAGEQRTLAQVDLPVYLMKKVGYDKVVKKHRKELEKREKKQSVK